MKGEDKPHEASEREKGPSAQKFMDMNITFYLQDDGGVVITDLPRELLDLVKELDPRAEIFCTLQKPSEKK